MKTAIAAADQPDVPDYDLQAAQYRDAYRAKLAQVPSAFLAALSFSR